MRYPRSAAVAGLLVMALTVACKSSSTSNPDGPSNPASTVTILAGSAVDYGSPNRPSGGTGFSPNTLTVALGATVTWSNNDSVDHDPTSDSGVFSGDAAPGGSYKFTFDKTGAYPYHCSIHPEMIGTIIVQ